MKKIEITDEYISKLNSQFEVWAAFLNTGIGLLAFTLAIASLGTASPIINAWLSIVVIFLVRINGYRFFPEEIKSLRLQAKEDQKAQVVLDGLMATYLGFKTNFTTYHLFLFGVTTLFLVAFSPFIAKVIPWWGVYVGI